MIKAKRGMGLKPVIFLMVLAIIVLVFIAFYLWYFSQGKELKQTIRLEAEAVQEATTLITLLNLYADSERTIADAIAMNDFGSTSQKASQMLSGSKYSLFVDGAVKLKSNEEPESPIVQQVLLPTNDMRIVEVKLEIER